MEYLFGDTDVAARRLEVLAEVFAEATRAFLLEVPVHEPRLAVDLGCGPGYSTHLLAETLGCRKAVGLDNSEPFVSLARRTATEKVSFYLHDATTVPFPSGPPELVFCRLLLTHMKDPLPLIEKWAAQLGPGGLLLVDEVEWIETDNPVFSTYMSIVETMLEHQSNRLYVGPLLNGYKDTGLLRVQESKVRRYPVENNRAAAMFSLNIRSWKERPFIRRNYTPESIDRLERDLDALRDESSGEKGIEWGLRQIVYRRV